MGLTGKNNEEKIWNFLYSKIGNKFGVAGLMGNLYAESGLRPNNLQDTYEKSLGMTDEVYTSKVDSRGYSNFIRDSAGYGLAQWTFWTRKQSLLNYASQKNVSIGDLEMQLEFLIQEMTKEFPSVLSVLKNAKSVSEASNKVLIDFEAAGGKMSSEVQAIRTSYGQTYYNRYGVTQKEEAKVKASSIYDLAAKSLYAKYMISNSPHYISNCGGDEKGGARGGTAGDQTGNEWTMRSWYNKPWDCVLRYPDINVGIKLAELGCKAAENNHVGYDQNERYTYWQYLQRAGYDPSKITTNCETDCSAGIIANTKAVGYLLNLSKLKDIKATYTGDMKQSYINAGFQVLTGTQYTTTPNNLLPGDILLNEAKHTATNVTLGANTRTGVISNQPLSNQEKNDVLTFGMKGNAVKIMQNMLIACGFSCGSYGADGDFGQATFNAVREFQKSVGISVDGVYGANTKAKLELLYKEKQNAAVKPSEKPAKTASSFKSYLVKIAAKSLNIRQQPSTSSKIVGKITDQGIYTIVEESGTWGKLKSGAGWISLNYTKKV